MSASETTCGGEPFPPLGSTLRVLEPAPHVLAFYDGRVPEQARAFSDKPNWLDDGAYSLGIATYAVVDGDEALVYDTHISLAHARRIRETLAARGARHIKVVLSHWHDDHVAGNEVFADCEIIANDETMALLQAHRDRLENGFPPIRPLVLPNLLFRDRLELTVGSVPVTLHHLDIHSRDGTVAMLPDGLLLAGDTLEDTVTYVDEADRLAIHLKGLEQLSALKPRRILPDHGAEEIIAAGGYGPELITATRLYIEQLLRLKTATELAKLDLSSFAREAFATGALRYFAPYEEVHRRNVAAVLAASRA